MKMIKIFKSSKSLQKWFDSIQIPQVVKQIITSLINMLFLLHMVGCFFAIAANVSEAFEYQSWIQEFGLEDQTSD